MIDYKNRSLQKEILDQKNIPFADIALNMKELDWINSHLGGHSITIEGFRKLLGEKKSISVCEIGCGGGDNLNALYKFCISKNIKASFIGIDINAECIAFAKENSLIKNPELIVSDYKNIKYENEKPDIIFSSLFCHHFSDEELIEMMKWMKENSTIGFFINDLHRHPIAYHFIKIATKFFSKSYLVKNDAPVSVLRGFKKNEWKNILEKAGIKNYSIKWRWAFRFLIHNVMAEAKNDKIEKQDISLFTAAIIGGGLAGLSLSILLSKAGYKTILFEKEKYPFHKVCGEYISLESWNFIEKLGLKLSNISLPIIKKLIVSSPNGNVIATNLDLGGFGISRFFLDNELKKIAIKNGVTIYEETKVTDVLFHNEMFTVKYNGGEVVSKIVAGSFGKRSNLDIKLKRNFINQKPNKLNNYIGVKYHVKNNLPIDTIALHNFENGYCGVSKIENGESCLCYLTTAENLQRNHNSIKEMEKNILFKNPFLKKIFTESQFLFKEPVTISQISFDKKKQIENHVLMLGDSAGMITPLCGNGMSMAFHSSKIAFENITSFLKGEIGRDQMELNYKNEWTKQFEKRLKNGRMIQRFFGKEKLTNFFISIIKPFPFLINRLVKSTHGKEF